MTLVRVNPETQFTEAGGKLTQEGFNALQSLAAGVEGASSGTPGAGVKDGWSGNISRVSNKDLTLIQECSFAGTITSTTTQARTGTATFTFKVEGAAFSGTANDVSTTEQTQTHSTSFAIGNKVIVTMSGNSSCEDAAFTIHYTRS